MGIEAFKKLEKLGEGSYGKVYKAVEKATGKIVALKRIKHFKSKEGIIRPAVIREISILQLLSSYRNFVKLMGVIIGVDKRGKRALHLVFEYMETDVNKFIKSYGSTGDHIPPKIVKSLMYQLCKGVELCHSHAVLHRDLKPHNLLMDGKTLMLKIADLGLARKFTHPVEPYTPKVVTLFYRAPELLLGAALYSTAIDMWSVGCIFAELVTNTAIFAGRSQYQVLLNIFRLLGTPSEDIWPGVTDLKDWHEYPQWEPKPISTCVPNLDKEGLDLLARMFVYDPSRRISAKKAQEHPYFRDLDKTSL